MFLNNFPNLICFANDALNLGFLRGLPLNVGLKLRYIYNYDSEVNIVKEKKRNPNPTIKDVARLANVGIATVSRVLNNSEKVSEKTKEKVLEIIEELGYSPNINARTLSSKNINSLSFVTPDMGNEFYGIMYSLLEKKISRNNYRLIVFPLIDQISLEKIKQNTDLIYQTDGVFISSLSVSSIFHNRIPPKKIILIDSYDERFDSVYVDNYQVGKTAAQYLINNSPANSTFYLVTFKELNNEFTSFVFKKRDEGFLEVMEENNKKVKIIYSDLLWDGGYKAIGTLIKRRPRKYSSIFATCDMIGVGVKKYLEEMNMYPKKDYSLIAVDNLPISRLFQLTTIRQPISEMVEIAYEMFVSSMEGREKAEHYKLEAKIVERET
nr:LacI family DNA-binding transcriptional regulator [Petrotoga sp. 8T1HF07.NaAc.6.1]